VDIIAVKQSLLLVLPTQTYFHHGDEFSEFATVEFLSYERNASKDFAKCIVG
jgi:hypothetical protein